jgi:hypothetical protein
MHESFSPLRAWLNTCDPKIGFDLDQDHFCLVHRRAELTAMEPRLDIATLSYSNVAQLICINRGRDCICYSPCVHPSAVAQRKETEKRPAIDDLTIREEVMARLDGQPWTRLSPVNVIVQDGTVDLWGIVDSGKEAVRVAAELTPGVCTINDHLVTR